MQLLFIITALLITFATLVPFSRSRAWWVRGLDFPRLQLAVAALLWLVAGVVSGLLGVEVPLAIWVLVVACFIHQAWWIFPYTSLSKKEVASIDVDHGLPELTLMTSNVLMDNRDAGPLLAIVRKYRPDVLATLETDGWWEEQLNQLEEYPYRLKCALDNKYGMHLYSRLPLHNCTIDYLVEEDIPSMGVGLELDSKCLVNLHILHPRPPAPGENDRSLERDVELLVLAKHLQDQATPVIVSGDLNDVAWSRTTRLFRRVSGLLDIRVGRGMFNTFHSDFPFLRWPLDHVFVSGHFKVVTIKRLEHIGSDHFPVLATLACDRIDRQGAPEEPEAADKELVRMTADTDVAEQASEPGMS